MDGSVGQKNGEATTAVPVLYDLVAFKNKGTHGERGLVVYTTPKDDKLAVMCVDGAVVHEDAGNLTVVDRSYIRLGDIVVSSSDPGGQIGVVTKATTTLDLVQLSNGINGGEPVARDVSPAELRRVRKLSVSDYVVSGRWLGRVVEVPLVVDVRFDDGAVCRVADPEDKLTPVTGGGHVVCRDTNTSFYPGQRVAAAAAVPTAFSSSQWLNGSCWHSSHVEGTVAKVEMAGALVYWVASPELGTNRYLVKASAPPAWQHNPGDLTLFASTGDCFWAVGDCCFFRNAESYRKKKKKRGRRRGDQLERPMCVLDSRTTANVVWQNGTRQRGVPSASLVPSEVLNNIEFLPGEGVIGWAVANAAGAAARYGVVRSLDVRDQTVRVSWFRAGKRGGEVECDETVSAYDLEYHHDIFYGNVVVRLRPLETAGSYDEGGGRTRTPIQGTKGATIAAQDLSWVGRVIDLCNDRRVQVKWGDKTMSKVFPHEISVVEEQTIKEMKDEMRATADNVTAGTPMLSTPMVSSVMQRLIRLVAEVWAKGKKFLVGDSGTTPSWEPAAMENDSQQSNADGSETIKKSAANVATRGGDDLFGFLQFDVVQMSPPDHFFLIDANQGIDRANKWTNRVQKEWKILKNDLPDTIYVRAFEDRMDLLRVAMVGAVGTPYQDCLFFFDVQLPPTYPAVPPLVHYHSFGLNVNQNLDDSGTVCLSLLETFGGEGVELWSPETSTTLQMVVSIQGLVLTSQPFYSESAFEKHHGTAKAARNLIIYAEDACLATLRTMLHLLRRPPMGFEELVHRHFRHRGSFILRACEAYLHKGCPVGTLDAEARATEVGCGQTCSAGFKLALTKFMPLLIEAFTAIGANGCDQFDTIGTVHSHC